MVLTRWEPFDGLTPLCVAMNQQLGGSFILPMSFGLGSRVFSSRCLRDRHRVCARDCRAGRHARGP
jgi:hypothetical protein